MKYYRITNADGKTWIMPSRHMRVGLELYQPSAWRGHCLKRFLPWIAPFAPLRALLHIEVCASPLSPEVEKALHQVFALSSLSFAYFGGTPCNHQKATLQIAHGHDIVGYCKVTQSASIAQLFDQETAFLQFLNRNGVRDVPCPLLTTRLASGEYIFVQSTQKTLHAEMHHTLGSLECRFLRTMADATRQTLRFEDTDQARALLLLPPLLPKYTLEVQETLVAARNKELAWYGGQTVTFSAYHADFTPWNMFVVEGRLFVFDWEYARYTYLPHLDALHYFVQTMFFEQHLTVEAMEEHFVAQQPLLRPLFDNPYQALLVYLLDVFIQYADREKEGGDTADTRRLQSMRLAFLRWTLQQLTSYDL